MNHLVHKIICGDCIEVMKEMESDSIDLVVTSPPYNIGIDYGVWKDNLGWDEYYEWCRKWLKRIYKILKEDGRFCLNHYLSLGQSNNRHSPLMDLNWIAVKEIGFKHHGIAIWTDRTLTKRTAWGSWLSASSPYINSPYEGILMLYKHTWKKRAGKSTIEKNEFMRLCSGIWDMQPQTKQLTPSNFPLELPISCINLLSFEKDVVLDPFLGSGTTMVAAERLGRNSMGIEISKEYCEIAYKRLLKEVKQTKLNRKASVIERTGF